VVETGFSAPDRGGQWTFAPQGGKKCRGARVGTHAIRGLPVCAVLAAAGRKYPDSFDQILT